MTPKDLYIPALLIFTLGFFSCTGGKAKPKTGGITVTINHDNSNDMKTCNRVVKSDDEWKKQLTGEQFYILREKGTERAFTGKYDKFYEKGVYKCAACGNELFLSEDKYNSGSGWPSYTRPASPESVTEKVDRSHFMVRTEILCSVCGGHLGHVFNDGPAPAGKRYCMNSGALEFEKK